MSTQDFYQNIDSIYSPLQSFALGLTKNMDDARDLFQETVFKALKNKDKFSIGTNFKAWIMTLMRNTFINEYRRKKRHAVTHAASDSFYFEASKDNTTIKNLGTSNLEMEELNKMLTSIDEKLSKPFMMYYIGMSYQEISDDLNVPLGTIKSRIFFARKELQALAIKAGLR